MASFDSDRGANDPNDARLERDNATVGSPYARIARLEARDVSIKKLRNCQQLGVVESDLGEIKERLDHITDLLTSTTRQVNLVSNAPGNPRNGMATGDPGFQTESPYILVSTPSVMYAFGLDPDFAQSLLRVERATALATGSGSTRLFIQHHQAASALAAFSERVHIWYPIFDAHFTDDYFCIMSGPLSPGSDTCLALLVAALGCLAEHSTNGNGHRSRMALPFFEAALASLPAVVIECSVASVQCLLLFGIYHCCTLRVCQAQDYSVIASFKIQNLIKGRPRTDCGWEESVLRVFWAALLLENEVGTQFDVAHSGIWALDEQVPLPDLERTWHFSHDSSSPVLHTSPSDTGSLAVPPGISVAKVQSYCLAEIAMRRMLHRCNSAVTLRHTGGVVYAPAVALELELQLQEWYNYLPGIIRFDIETAHDPASPATLHGCPLTTFLRVQYHCCKIAIYWPAVYQAIETGAADGHLLNHCKRLFHSYVHLIPCIVAAFELCVVNRWTLFLSTFMNTMAALKAADVPALRSVCSPGIEDCFAAAMNVDRDVINQSPALQLLYTTLQERLSAR
ncbi:hypothetical protein LTR27_008125 [Elasticomyces elasticus]|nr:hypothetical protein LTR27_008125 [Elasticomyces elasticus]